MNSQYSVSQILHIISEKYKISERHDSDFLSQKYTDIKYILNVMEECKDDVVATADFSILTDNPKGTQ